LIGESWAHTCSNRIFLKWKNGKRIAHLHKSSSLKSFNVYYEINEDGLRGSSTSQKRKRDDDDSKDDNESQKN
jgi:hypothetical protein